MKRKRLFVFIFAILLGFLFFSPIFAAKEVTIIVEEVSILEGTWQGYVFLPDGQLYRINLYIKNDGSYRAFGDFMVVGQITLANGELSYVSSRGATGKVVLYEGDKRKKMIRFFQDGDKLTGEYIKNKN